MPIPKSVKDARVARGECAICRKPTVPDPESGKRPRHCPEHLRYFRNYRQTWNAENGVERKNKCTLCRKVGHFADKCPDRPSAN